MKKSLNRNNKINYVSSNSFLIKSISIFYADMSDNSEWKLGLSLHTVTESAGQTSLPLRSW